jgi:hypothetical protein
VIKRSKSSHDLKPSITWFRVLSDTKSHLHMLKLVLSVRDTFAKGLSLARIESAAAVHMNGCLVFVEDLDEVCDLVDEFFGLLKVPGQIARRVMIIGQISTWLDHDAEFGLQRV